MKKKIKFNPATLSLLCASLAVILTGLVFAIYLATIKEDSDSTTQKENGIQNEGGNENGSKNENDAEIEIIMFHNNAGPMCLEALEFFEEEGIEITQYLTTDSDFSERLSSYEENFTASEGVSTNFGYYPIIFANGHAYSGFNDEIKSSILSSLEK